MSDTAEILGRNIRKFRVMRRHTQEDLSELVGIHYTFLGHIERGSKIPSLPTFLRIADALGIPPCALFNGHPISRKYAHLRKRFCR